MRELKPILKKFTKEEYKLLMDEATDAMMRGDEEEYLRILSCAPMSPGQAAELKHSMGIKKMIQEGINLSWAVEAYGEDWLKE